MKAISIEVELLIGHRHNGRLICRERYANRRPAGTCIDLCCHLLFDKGCFSSSAAPAGETKEANVHGIATLTINDILL